MPRVMLTMLGEDFGRAATSSRGCISLHPSGQQPGQLFGRRKCASVNNTVGVDCVRNLYGKIAIAVSVTLFATASSRAKENEACISKASKTLPHISGLVINGPVLLQKRSWRRGRDRPDRLSWMWMPLSGTSSKPIHTCVC